MNQKRFIVQKLGHGWTKTSNNAMEVSEPTRDRDTVTRLIAQKMSSKLRRRVPDNKTQHMHGLG